MLARNQSSTRCPLQQVAKAPAVAGGERTRPAEGQSASGSWKNHSTRRSMTWET